MNHQQNPIKNKLRKFQSAHESKLEDSDISFFPTSSSKDVCDSSQDVMLRNLIREQEENIRDLTTELCQQEQKYCKKYAKRDAELQDRVLKLHDRLTFEIKRNQHLEYHLKSLKEGNAQSTFSQQTSRNDYLLGDL